MFAKLATVIVSMGVIACLLLAVRQQRIQAAHELGEVQQRVLASDRTLWHLRAEIAAKVTPERVEAAAKKYGPLAAKNIERYRELLKRENEQALTAATSHE